MGKRERYEPGTFCWVDLATTDPAGAKAFYGALFGWETETAEENGQPVYVSIKNAERSQRAIRVRRPRSPRRRFHLRHNRTTSPLVFGVGVESVGVPEQDPDYLCFEVVARSTRVVPAGMGELRGASGADGPR
jgi:hypothetical protein